MLRPTDPVVLSTSSKNSPVSGIFQLLLPVKWEYEKALHLDTFTSTSNLISSSLALVLCFILPLTLLLVLVYAFSNRPSLPVPYLSHSWNLLAVKGV